jgi:hypothetical protein
MARPLRPFCQDAKEDIRRESLNSRRTISSPSHTCQRSARFSRQGMGTQPMDRAAGRREITACCPLRP